MADLQRWVSGKLGPIFPGLATKRTRKLIKLDLAEAGIPHKTDVGVRCFHSLRNTYISALFDSGASMPSTQRLARHSTPTLTAKSSKPATYEHAIVDSLPCPNLVDPVQHQVREVS